jgi:hypothetical protein
MKRGPAQPALSHPQLRRAVDSAAHYFDGAPKATVVHDLAVKGAEALVRQRGEEDAALDVLETIDELAWSA